MTAACGDATVNVALKVVFAGRVLSVGRGTAQ